MPNMIKVMDVSKEVILEIPFSKQEEFFGAVMTAISTVGTDVVMYQKDLPKPLVTALRGMVNANEGVIRTEESKLLPPYEKASGFGTVDYKSSEYWEHKGYDPNADELVELSDLYELILDSKKRILEITGFKAKAFCFTIKKITA